MNLNDFGKIAARNRNQIIAHVVTFAAGMASGAFGYREYQKRYNPGFKEMAGGTDVAIERMYKELKYSAQEWEQERRKVKEAFVVDLEKMMSSYATHLVALVEDASRRDKEVIADTEEKLDRVHIFHSKDAEEDVWDYDEELKHRSPDAPYIIHRDEFYAREEGYGQLTLSYYIEDDVLCDDKDIPVYNYDRVVGQLKFGHGSEDPSICYVRNDRINMDYEIILEHTSYYQEVLGQDAENEASKEIKHSLPKFRQE